MSPPCLLSYPLPLSLAHLDERYRPGDLSGSPCTLAQFPHIPPYSADVYDLVAGRLRSKPPPDPNHAIILRLLASRLRAAVAASASERCVTPNASVSTPSRWEGAETRAVRSVRRVDLCVSRCMSGGDAPRCVDQVAGVIPGHVAEMVVEITSLGDKASRSALLLDKWDEFERAGVSEYVVVDRDDPSRDGYDPAVIVGRLVPGKGRARYRESHFRGDELLTCSYFGGSGITAEHVLMSWLDCDRAQCRRHKSNEGDTARTLGATVGVGPIFDGLHVETRLELGRLHMRTENLKSLANFHRSAAQFFGKKADWIRTYVRWTFERDGVEMQQPNHD